MPTPGAPAVIWESRPRSGGSAERRQLQAPKLAALCLADWLRGSRRRGGGRVSAANFRLRRRGRLSAESRYSIHRMCIASSRPKAYLGAVKRIDYCVYREKEFFVAQCLNVDVSSFGHTRADAVANLKEAVELYFHGETTPAWEPVSDVSVGQELIHV